VLLAYPPIELDQLVRENGINQRLLEEGNERRERDANQISELERLVFDQHAVIESIQERCHRTENQEELLMTTQLQLGSAVAESRAWQSRYHQLEENSKYLANQIDELLPQISLKNSKISQLENQMKAREQDQRQPLIESATQTDSVFSPGIRDRPSNSSSETALPKISSLDEGESSAASLEVSQTVPSQQIRTLKLEMSQHIAHPPSAKTISETDKKRCRKVRPSSTHGRETRSLARPIVSRRNEISRGDRNEQSEAYGLEVMRVPLRDTARDSEGFLSLLEDSLDRHVRGG
jgi:hypothetical protein